jgi:hypothetical protein
MANQRFRTRYPGTCVECGSPVESGSWSYWERGRRGLTCCACAESSGAERGAARRDDALPYRELRRTPDGPNLVAVHERPAPGAYASSTSTDAAIDRILDELAADGVRMLHGLRIPKLRVSIDHIAVAPSGVYVIDTKSDEGSIAWVRRRFSRKHELYVGIHNRTAWLSGLRKPVDAVRAALDGAPVPLHPTIATVRVQWPPLHESFAVDDVTVLSWPVLRKRLGRPGPLQPETTEQIARILLRSLPPALDRPRDLGRSAGAAATSV